MCSIKSLLVIFKIDRLINELIKWLEIKRVLKTVITSRET